MTRDKVKFLDSLSTFKNILVFSPHFDDAIFSMGSLLTTLVNLNKKIKVINVFTQGSQIISEKNSKLLKQANIPHSKEYFARRKQEDWEAFQKIGKITIENLDFIDAAWRVGKDNSPLYTQTIMGEIHQADKKLAKQVENKIKKFKKSLSNTAFFAPLGRGKHVDHQIVKNSITNNFDMVIYYTDYPYSRKYENEDKFIMEFKLFEAIWQGDSKKKKKAVLTYKTQLASLSHLKQLKLTPEIFYFKSKIE